MRLSAPFYVALALIIAAAANLAALGNAWPSGRPAGCPAQWCGCWLEHYFGLGDRSLWRARNWLRVGSQLPGPRVGAIVVYARGAGGHVGLVTEVISPTRIRILSGNDGGQVRERERSTAGVIGYRYYQRVFLMQQASF